MIFSFLSLSPVYAPDQALLQGFFVFMF